MGKYFTSQMDSWFRADCCILGACAINEMVLKKTKDVFTNTGNTQRTKNTKWVFIGFIV